MPRGNPTHLKTEKKVYTVHTYMYRNVCMYCLPFRSIGQNVEISCTVN